MKRVLIIGNNDIGLYNFRLELLQELLQDHEVHFTVPYGEKAEALKDLGAHYHSIELNRRGTSMKEDLTALKQYKKLMEELNPDAVLTYTIKPNIYGGLAAQSLKIPYIATVTGLGTALQGKGIKQRLLKALYRQGIRGADFVFFQNAENRRFFLENSLVSERKTVLVPGSGVNTSHYEYIARTQSNKGSVTFLYIARVMQDKGIEEYLEAAQSLKNQYTEARFQILGYYDEECYSKQVEALAAQGIIEYLGVSNDTRKEMTEADCIVLPSYHEGMSNVLLEGASSGLPLITTDIHGCAEAVEDGVTGFLCKVKDANSLAFAMERFILLSHDERIEMGKKGREKMIREFERRLVVEQYMQCIRQAAGEA